MGKLSDIDLTPKGQKEAINELAGIEPNTYEYGFTLWPDGKWNFPSTIFEVFDLYKYRVECIWTEEHFNKVRSDLSHIGLVMHEISRRPHIKEEVVL